MTIHLTPETARVTRSLAHQEGVMLSELVEKALIFYIRQKLLIHEQEVNHEPSSPTPVKGRTLSKK